MTQKMGVRRSVHDLGVLLQKPACSGLAISFCEKQATLGTVCFRQFWLKNSSIYGGRGRRAENQPSILNFFHRMTVDAGCLEDHRKPAETFLLASLASEIRSNKAQQVFPDASLANWSSAYRCRKVAALDAQLRQSSGETMTSDDFYRHSRTVCELAEMSNNVIEEYLTLELQLFDGVLDDWIDEPETCKQLVNERWRDWMLMARRSSCKQVFKDVLNILSYESKAALHQCYSLLWIHLADAFADLEGSAFVRQFNRFWHCDHRIPTGVVQDMHLLHGHIFGLHPAFSMMIQTEVGGNIIANAIGHSFDSSAMRTFFAAAIVSLNFYMSDRIESRRLR
ncbi:hypothetical protein RRSWK_02527 [Rhodopirellula sp. SWK7]|nr:hypothetical protein RRSWK_02527 [Rhodopirellula sp. SWK7]